MNSNDDLGGITEAAGDDAARAAGSAERAARAGGSDPLANLAARVLAEGDAAAFDPAALDAAARQRADEPAAYAALRGALKRARGFSVTRWEKAVDARERERRAEDKARAEREASARAGSLRDALARARAEASATTAAARAAAPPDVAPHHAEHVIDDDAAVRFVMEPGRISAERPVAAGRVETRTLAAFSAAIVADVHELDTPTGRPRRAFDLSVMLPGDARPARVEGIGADEFRRMEWPETRVGSRAVVYDTGRREDLRAAIQGVSRAAEVHRYRFTGWHAHQGRPVYLHASGAIGEDGPVAGLRAESPAPAHAFDLGETAAAPRDAAAAVLDLLSVDPAAVVVPLVGAAFRAAMGPSRLSVHVSGRPGTGKSLLVSLAQQLFGRAMRAESLPCSWADGSTANGIARVLSRVGDAVVAVDDLRFGGGPGDARVAELFDRVTRAQFNGAAPVKLTRDGGSRTDPASRAVILSTGETPPRGHSTRARVVCVELNERPSPDLSALMQRANAGELARAMASFVRWYAARHANNLPRLDALERAAAARWALGVTDRAAGLFGALALGAELLFAWCAEAGADPGELARHEARARDALARVARDHGEGVEGENPAHRFLPLLREALTAGEAHVAGLRPDGRTAPPADPDAWGWRTDGDGPRQQGKRVGWVRGAEVFVDPGVALDVVRARATREGHPIPADRRALARDLRAAGLLARTELHGPRGTLTCRVRVGAGVQRDALVFSAEAFGGDPAAGPPAGTTSDAPDAPDPPTPEG